MSVVTSEHFKERMAICLECAFISPDKRKCKACGCHLSIKCKFKYSKCPKKKWGKNCEVE